MLLTSVYIKKKTPANKDYILAGSRGISVLINLYIKTIYYACMSDDDDLHLSRKFQYHYVSMYCTQDIIQLRYQIVSS